MSEVAREIKAVTLRTNEYLQPGGATRTVDQIEVFMFDLWLRCDIGDDRDVRLAKRLADAAGIELRDYRKERKV